MTTARKVLLIVATALVVTGAVIAGSAFALAGGNMLTMKLLASLPTHDGPMVIYGEGTNLSDERLRSLSITFKKTPNDIRAR